ncbi:hypothetical protein L3X38_002788 [Prunus dulcis]|uniref:Uncharacterized protein n=1 Tax=Prunus dulcis TaxID=3755 RepID=A0AAD4ZKC1_PRUDU|nr:hypothetical protein L3X38_002788 [Prunus dulcis]
MADSGQAPAPPRLVLVGEGRRPSWLSIGTGAGDRHGRWRPLGRLEGGKVLMMKTYFESGPKGEWLYYDAENLLSIECHDCIATI